MASLQDLKKKYLKQEESKQEEKKNQFSTSSTKTSQSKLNELTNKYLTTTYSGDDTKKWFEEANSIISGFSKSKDSEYTTYSNADTKKLQSVLDSSKDVFKYIRTHKGEITNYSDLYKGYTQLTDALKSVIKANEFYSQFDSEDSYNTWKKTETYKNMSSAEIKKYIKDDPNGVAYTTDDGKNVTWQSLYDRKKAEEDFNSRYKEYSSRSDWEVNSQGISNVEDTRSDFDIVFELSRTNVPYDRDIALSNGVDEATYNDIEEKRKYISNKYGVDLYSNIYDNVNIFNDLMSKLEKQEGETESFEFIPYLTDEERKFLSYIYNTQGRNAALEWQNSIESTLQDRANQATVDNMSMWAEKHPVLTSLGSVALNTFAGIQYVGDVVDYIGTGELDTNQFALASSTIRDSVSEQVNWEIGNWDAFDFIYNTGMSMADSASSMMFMGGLGGVSQGLSAAAQATNDALNRGVPKNKAFWTGVLAGTFEGLFETISIGQFSAMKEVATTSGRVLAKNLGKTMLVNATEEMATEIGNIATDLILNGDFSQYETSIRQYMNYGMTESEAKRKAAIDIAGQIVEAGASGALMGFGFGVLGSGSSYIANKSQYNKQVSQHGQSLIDQGSVDSLLQLSSEMGDSKGIEKLSSKVSSNPTAKNVGKLSAHMEDTISSKNEASFKKALVEKGLSKKAASKVAKYLTDSNELSKEDIATIEGSKRIQTIIDEVLADPNLDMSDDSFHLAEARLGVYTTKKQTEATEESTVENAEEITSEVETTPTTETTAEKGFEASTEGITRPVAKATMVDGEGNTVETKVAKITDVENGEATLELEGGQTVKASDVDFGDSGIGLVYKAATEMVSGVGGFNVDAANLMVKGFNPSGNIREAGTYVSGFNEAYRYGAMGYPVSALETGNVTSKLSVAQREVAYNLGKAYGNEKVAEKQAKIDSTVSIKVGKDSTKATKKGKVYFDGSAVGKTLTERQRASLKGLRVVAEATGVNIHIFESKVGKDGKRQGANGWYDPVTKEIHLDLHAGVDGNGVMLFTASHELTHHIREVAPAKFKVFADALLEEFAKNGVSLDTLIENKIKSLERNGRLEGKTKEEAYDLAYEEVVADACESMLVDSDAIEALSRKLQAKDKGLWQTIKDFIAKLVARIKEAYKGLDPDSAEGKFVREMSTSLERLQKLWVDALLEASEVTVTEGTGETKYSYSSIAYSFFGDENISIKDMESGAYKKTEGYKQYVDQCLNNMRQSVEGFNEKTALKEIRDSIDGIVEVAVAMKKAGYDILDSEGGRNTRDSKKRLLFSSLEPNSDYFTSSDISTICDKRINFAEIYDEIVRREDAMGVPKNKRFFNNIDNYFVLHKILADKGLTAPCRQCYVESMRKNLDPMANAFIELMQETDPNNKANKQLYQPSGKNKGELKSNNAKLRENLLEVIEREQYDITADDLTIKMLTTADGLAQLKLQAPLIYEAFNSFYGQSKPKMPKAATPFRFGELTALLTDDRGRIKTGLINQIKSTGGFRLQSYSDFQIQNFADVLQVIFEAGTLGLNGHAYTKVPAFLDATKGTNLKRNISIFMYKDGGQWKIDRGDSFPYELEAIYDIVDADKSGNTGIIAVVQNEDMAAWIMANGNVGYFIPFHKSGVKMGVVRETIVKEGGREIKGYSGIKDHTRQQTEVWAKTNADHKANTKVKKGINIYEFWDFDNVDNLSTNELIEKNVKAYIDACNEAGYLPKFREYVMNNSKVLNSVLNYSKQLGFVSQNATIDDISFEYSGYRIPYGYYKCLLDFGMFTPDGEASPIERLSLKNYNFKEAVKFFSDAETLRRNEILQQFENGFEREKYRNSDMTTAELAEEVQKRRNQVVDEVVSGEYKKVKYSDRDSSYLDAVNRGDMETAQRMVDEAAKEAGYTVKAYHGTNQFGFTKFDASKSDDKSTFFFSNDLAHASTYAGKDIYKTKSIKDAKSFKYEKGKKYTKEELKEAYDVVQSRWHVYGEIKINEEKQTISHAGSRYSAKQVMEMADRIGKEGIYGVYLNTDNFLEVDAEGKTWGNINAPDDFFEFVKETSWGGQTPYVTTRDYAKYARAKGYDGLIIRNLKDWGNRNSPVTARFERENSGAHTDYILFDSNRVKSADPVTYDDNGNVIPLSERFKADNNDIRYSDRDSQKVSYAPTFYSHMGKVIDDIKLDKMGTSSILNHLKNRGVKAEEIKWSGIEAFLEGKKSVTKAELQEFVAGSQLQIEEEISGEENWNIVRDGDSYIVKDRNGKILETWEPTQDPEDPDLVGWISFGGGDIASTIEEIREYTSDWYGNGGPRWSQYRLDGGSNYRELVFKMPNSSYSNESMKAHWGQDAEGVLAHARIQDMTTSDGKKMLFIEEIQSDWHNEGRQEGYDDGKLYEKRKGLEQKVNEAFFKLEDYSVAATGLAGEWETIERTPRGANLLREYREAQAELKKVEDASISAVPDAPFRNNYHEYVLKRLIRMAAEEGYDSIGWTPADIQSERWSDRYSEGYRIEYDQDIPKFLRKYGKKWGATVDKADIKQEALGDRERILKENELKNVKRDLEKAKKQLARTSRSYERAFVQSSIDSMEQTIATLEKELSESLSVWSMSIPDSMQESVLYEGQVLYSDRNTASFKGKAFWSGSVSLLDGVIEEVHTMEEAEAADYHHSLYFSPEQVEKMDNEENAFFFVENGEVQGDWRVSVPEDIIKRIEEQITIAPKYQDRNPDSYSNRSLLAGALESAVQNDIEREKLKQYKQKIDLINAEEQKLHDLREQIKELSFKKGPRDTQAIKSLQFEANQAANRINTYDRQLLNLESTKALKGVLEREKALARKKAEQQGKEALERYRERAAKTQRELMTRYQESRDKAREGRNKTAMRHKIKGLVSELNTLLLRPTSKKHIKEELRKEVAAALSAINMDTVGADERVAMYNDLIAKESNPDVIAELTKTRDRIQLQGEMLKDKLATLQMAYEKIKSSEDIELSMSYKEVIRNSIANVAEKVGDTPIRNMTLEQLEMVYELFSMIRHTIRDVNKTFKGNKSETNMQRAEAVNDQVRTVGGQPYKRNVITKALMKEGWRFLKPYVAFRTIGSVTLTNLYKELRNGEDVFYEDVKAAQKFIEEQYEKHNYKSWDMKKTKTFTAKSGKTFDLTLEQMMSLYAYSRRPQAIKHIQDGGIVFEDAVITEKNKLGIPIKYEVTTKDAFNISGETLVEIANSLTAEQKAFVEAMQGYLSTTMGAKGNDVSMELLGVKLFKEEFYFPIKSSQQYMNFKPEEAGEIMLRSPAFSKETVPHANNPVVLHNFTDLWAEHINNMSMYHSFVLALEDFTKVYNYKTKTDSKVETMSTKATLETAYPGVTNYINKFLRDMNGGVRGETVGWAEKLTSLAKKGAVLGSASVAIQQPSAVMRAMAMVNPRYFVTTAHKSVNLAKHKQDWAELKKYAPIAGIKEMGRFDVGMGQATADWIKSNKTLMEKGEDIISIAPAYMDEVTWVTIWNAVKRETAHNNPTLKTSSDEFLKLAGERFTDVISLTQVYDSVFSRSDLMRNKSWIAKAVTAFMAEPTTTLNMIWDSLIQGKRTGSTKGFVKATTATGSAIAASIVFNAALKSIIMAMRDDDEDESYREKYLEHFFGDLKDSLNPLTLVPYVKDVVSIFKGYDAERMDMAAFADLKKAMDAFDSEEKTSYEKWSGLIGATAAFFGMPIKNVERDVRGFINTHWGKTEDTTEMGILNAIEEGWTGKEKSNGQQLYEAMVNGDTEQIERVKGRFKDQTAINSAIRKALRENDPRIKEAAEARYKGDIAEYMKIAKEIIAEGHFKQDDIVAAINSEINALKPDTPSTPSDKVVSLYSIGDYYTAIMSGKSSVAYAVKEDLIETEIANGKDRDEAEDSFNSKLSNHIREQYEAGEITEYKAEDMLTYAGKTEEEAASKVQYWSFKKEYPDYDLSESAVSKYYSDVESSGISVEVYYDYSKQRSKAKGEDLNGDGKTDSGSVKREVMQIIDSLPISSYQKDVLYFLNGWSQSTLWEAPWR